MKLTDVFDKDIDWNKEKLAEWEKEYKHLLPDVNKHNKGKTWFWLLSPTLVFVLLSWLSPVSTGWIALCLYMPIQLLFVLLFFFLIWLLAIASKYNEVKENLQ